jgi:hypothetical protein
MAVNAEEVGVEAAVEAVEVGAKEAAGSTTTAAGFPW